MSITVLSVNCAQQPKWIPGAMKYQSSRATELAKEILAQGVDIVAIQELFRSQSRKIIYDRLQYTFPYCYMDTSCGKYIIGVNSGLAIFSRFPLFNRSLHPYKVFRGVENFARKSLMHVTAEIDDSTSVEIFTTHLQTGIGEEPCICKLFDKNDYSSEKLKIMQIEELVDHVEPYKEKPIILLGDFNIRAGTDLYDEVEEILNNDLSLEDVFDASKSPCTSSVVGKSGRRIDYVWTNVENSEYIILEPWERPSETECSAKKFITDHHAIVGEISL